MLSGLPPFSSKEGSKALFSKIMTEKVKMPSGTTAAGCKLLKGLLNRNVLARFGTVRTTMFEVGGVAGLKQVDFFAHLCWDRLERKEVDPPATFAVNDDNDAQYFHDEFTTMALPRSVVDMHSERFLPRRVQSDAFHGFSFVHDDFLLPPRADDEEKSYWEAAAEEDAESASECASSKVGNDVLFPEVETPKKKRQRKRKKNTPAPAGTKDVLESRTANTTPLASTVNTPDPSDVGGDSVDYQESMNADQVEKGMQTLALSTETETIEAKPVVPTTAVTTVETSYVESFSSPATTPAPRPVANETWQDDGKATLQHSPDVKSFSSPARKPVVQETWQDIGKEKGKKSKPRDKKTTPSADRTRPPAQSGQTMHTTTATGHSTPNRNVPVRPAHQSSPYVPVRGQAPIKQEPVLPRRPPPPAPSGSSDWRQHSMMCESPQTAKPTVAPKLQPEAIVWPSLSSDQPEKQSAAATVIPAQQLSGAWAKRAVPR
jgi:Protein kinase C terminal domain